MPTYFSSCASSLVIFSAGILKDLVLPFAGVPQLAAMARRAKPMTSCLIPSHRFSRMPYECAQGPLSVGEAEVPSSEGQRS